MSADFNKHNIMQFNSNFILTVAVVLLSAAVVALVVTVIVMFRKLRATDRPAGEKVPIFAIKASLMLFLLRKGDSI